jgi:VCBS repeat-containing protein
MWLSGNSSDPTLPLKYPLQSNPATSTPFSQLEPTPFVSELNASGSGLLFSTFLGGSEGGGSAAGIAIDPGNKVHIVGMTGSGMFATAGAFLGSVTESQFDGNIYGYAAVIDPSVASPSVCFDPDNSAFFYNQLVGTTSTLTLNIINCGNAPLTISSITSSNSVFTIPAGTNQCLQSVAVGASCGFAVTFAPTAAVTVNATLTVTSNAPIPTTTEGVVGIGTLPQIGLSPTSILFDEQFVGQTSPTQPLLVLDGGLAPLHINLAATTISPGFAFTQSGCDQPVYSNCAMYLTFTPTVAGITTGALNIASDDPANPVISVALSGTGYTSYPTPTLSAVNPPTIPIGSGNASLQIQGTNFFPASVVYVGGVAQPTTYTGASNLTATVNASQLLTLGETQVTVFNPLPGGAESAPITLTKYENIPMASNNVVYNTTTSLLYAAIQSTDANNPNTVAVIDPVAGKVQQYIPVGSNPNALAVSSDGQYVYVCANGDHAIQRINTTTNKVDQTFATPTDSSGATTAVEMKTVPGSPLLLVMALIYDLGDPDEAGIALFNNGVLVNWIPAYYPSYAAVDSFDFAGTPPLVYGLGYLDGLQSFSVSSAGIQFQSNLTAPGQNLGTVLASDGTLLYTNTGQVWSPTSQSVIGTYLTNGGYIPDVLPDTTVGRTFFLDPGYTSGSQALGPAVLAYDQKSFGFDAAVSFPLFWATGQSLVRWGADGLAFVAGSTGVGPEQNLILFRSSIVGATAGQNPVPVIGSLGASSVTVGGPGFTLSVTGSNFVSGSVVQWNGSARTTTFVSATQLNAAITAADIAQTGSALVTVSNPAPGGGLSSPLAIAIVAPPPVPTLSGTSLTFASQVVGGTSAAQTITLSNTGASALTLTGVQITGDFAQTNTCGTSVAASASCTVSVTFTPTATGARTGTLTFSDNATGSPQTVTVSGTGAPDFAFGSGGSNTTTATVPAGQNATYSLSVASAANTSGTVNLTCTGAPANAHCSANPSSVVLAAGQSANFTVTITTGTTVTGKRDFAWRSIWAAGGLAWLLILPFYGRRNGNQFGLIAFLCVGTLLFGAGLAGCGGGGGGSSGGGSPNNLTAPGTYQLQVVATEGTTSHSQTITLVVQ